MSEPLYMTWLKHTLPKLEEWANSADDDAGDCPLVQDEAGWLLVYLHALESDNAKLKAELANANQALHTSRMGEGQCATENRNVHAENLRLYAELAKLQIKEGELLTENDAMDFKLNMDAQEIPALKAELDKKYNLANDWAIVAGDAMRDRDRWKALATDLVKALKAQRQMRDMRRPTKLEEELSWR